MAINSNISDFMTSTKQCLPAPRATLPRANGFVHFVQVINFCRHTKTWIVTDEKDIQTVLSRINTER